MKVLPTVAILIILFLLGSEARSELHKVREVHYQMGTLLDITLYYSDPEEGKKLLRRSVQETHRLEGILSHYDPQSSVSILNRQAGEGRVKIALELFHLLATAIQFSARTAGYFDVTVGPLVDLWQHAGEKGRLPGPELLSQTLNLVGSQQLKLYKTGEGKLLKRGMKIDLGGIGKGFAVDSIVEIFHDAGVKSALINFGGSSIYALGVPPGEKGWTIGIKGAGEGIVGAIRLRNQGLSTSGSMGRYWEIGGRRYGHLINPKSGTPVTELRSATAIATTATEAEALTKPLVLLGKQGMALTKNFPQTESLLISEDGEIHLSSGFASTTHFERLKNR
jgi:thiamine biosynthesis lipoprotein